jgi:ribonuclease Z
MKCTIEIVGNLSFDGYPCIIINTEVNKYMINVPEGCQRFCMEHKYRFSKLSKIIFLEKCVESMIGSPGLILTLADMGKKKCSVIGPGKVSRFFSSTRHFLRRDDVDFSCVDISPFHTFSLKKVSLGDISMTPFVAGFEDRANEYFDNGHSASFLPFKFSGSSVSEWPVDASEEVGSESSSSASASAAPGLEVTRELKKVHCLFETPPVIGKFLKDKAVRIGVPSGPAFGQLHRGGSLRLFVTDEVMREFGLVEVPLPSSMSESEGGHGRKYVEVHSHHVKEPDSPGAVFGVLANITLEEIDLLPSSWYTIKTLTTLIHCSTYSVTRSVQYQRWLSHFSPSVHHCFLGRPASEYTDDRHPALARQIACLTLAAPMGFLPPIPSLPLPASAIPQSGDLHSVISVLAQSSPLIPSFAVSKQIDEMVKFKSSMDKIVTKLSPLQGRNLDEKSSKHFQEQIPDDIEILFTGTGSAIPSKYRNVSGIFVKLPTSNFSVMLDAGEGTYGQLCRRFGYGDVSRSSGRSSFSSVDEAVSSIAIIFVSHMHADHHLGIPRLIIERFEAVSRAHPTLPCSPIVVIGPTKLFHWLEELSDLEPRLREKWVFLDLSFLSIEISSTKSTTLTAHSHDHHSTSTINDHLLPQKRPRDNEEKCFSSSPLDASFTSKHEDDEIDEESVTSPHVLSVSDFKVITRSLGITHVASVLVPHCFLSYAIRLEGLVLDKSGHSLPFSVIYSGDTRPCEEVVELSTRGYSHSFASSIDSSTLVKLTNPCTILIHEATFEDTEEGLHDAFAKKHSSFGEALQIIKKSNPAIAFITHFSARYPRFPVVPTSFEIQTPYLISFDLLSVKGADLYALWLAADRVKVVVDELAEKEEKEDKEDIAT